MNSLSCINLKNINHKEVLSLATTDKRSRSSTLILGIAAPSHAVDSFSNLHFILKKTSHSPWQTTSIKLTLGLWLLQKHRIFNQIMKVFGPIESNPNLSLSHNYNGKFKKCKKEKYISSTQVEDQKFKALLNADKLPTRCESEGSFVITSDVHAKIKLNESSITLKKNNFL